MRSTITRSFGLAGLCLVVACGPSQTAEPAGETATEAGAAAELFVHEAGFDAFGYYMADQDRIFGDWRLHHMFVGDSMMFDAFEAAGEPADEAPVWLEFWPVDGETAVNELGQEYAVDARRVRADSYAVERGRFELRAEDDVIGSVLVSGMLHPDSFENPASGPGFTGGMEVAGDLHRNVSLHYFAGD